VLSPVLFSIVAAILGTLLLVALTLLLPRWMGRFTPHIDEEREIAEGNRAVAEFHGRVVAALILGISIIIATSIYVGLY
jgi:ABC-type multidrug transport system fused ATPase/permease subunit